MIRLIWIFLVTFSHLSMISMLNENDSYRWSNEYSLQICCSFDFNDQIVLSCDQNEKISLKLIEMFYNLNE